MQNPVIQSLRETLQSLADEKTRLTGLGYFREEVQLYGIRSSVVTETGKSFYQHIKHLPKEEIYDLCEELWKSGMMEESFIACQWSYNCKRNYTPEDFIPFERWVTHYVNNWASCDSLCNHTIGSLVERYPKFLEDLKRWALSENRWTRRAAAVSLIVPARRGMFLKEIIEIATILLHDKDDMVQKGYGWMLKVASQQHLEQVFDFVILHKATMPRTALRYAIEKMPSELKAIAMAK